MTAARSKSRLWLGAGALVLILLALTLLLRLSLTGMAVNSLLQLAGASEIRFNVARASPWAVVVEDLGFQFRTQAFAAKRVTFARPHWWTPTLGAVRVEQARIPLVVDGSDTNPWSWSTYKNGTVAVEPTSVPVDEISVDGQLVLQAAAVPEQALTVRIEARLSGKNTWEASLRAEGPGLGLKASGTYDQKTSAVAFKVPEVSLDLKAWESFLQRVIVLPGGAWELEGKLAGSAEGRWDGKALTAAGRVGLREGRLGYAPNDVTIEGLEADLEFSDFVKFVTKPGTARARELRVGQLKLGEIEAALAFDGPENITVSSLALQALGGRAKAEPFKYFLNLRELEAVVLVEGISVAEVMALTQDLPAKASGRVNGRFPIRIDGSGLRLGTGWLELTPGVAAQIAFNASGLLTGGMGTSSPSYAVLKKIESGLLKLNITELRLDIRPPNAPPGRSAQLHIVGAPVDPEVKAPVTLDLNVNGPLEKLINLGLDSRVSFGK